MDSSKLEDRNFSHLIELLGSEKQIAILRPIEPGKPLSAIWPSGTTRKLQILRDGFDSRLEPIAFDVYKTGGC